MAVYSGEKPQIMSPHQFGGYDAIMNSSPDPQAQSADSVRTLATAYTVNQAARKTSNS